MGISVRQFENYLSVRQFENYLNYSIVCAFLVIHLAF